MEIKIGQIYKEKQYETVAMVVGIQKESVFLGTGNMVSHKTIEDRYVLLKDSD